MLGAGPLSAESHVDRAADGVAPQWARAREWDFDLLHMRRDGCLPWESCPAPTLPPLIQSSQQTIGQARSVPRIDSFTVQGEDSHLPRAIVASMRRSLPAFGGVSHSPGRPPVTRARRGRGAQWGGSNDGVGTWKGVCIGPSVMPKYQFLKDCSRGTLRLPPAQQLLNPPNKARANLPKRFPDYYEPLGKRPE